MTQNDSTSGAAAPARRMTMPWNRMAGLRRRLVQTVFALAPLSQMLDYSTRLRALSGGHGLFQMASDGFKQVSSQRAVEILKELGRM